MQKRTKHLNAAGTSLIIVISRLLNNAIPYCIHAHKSRYYTLFIKYTYAPPVHMSWHATTTTVYNIIY